MRGAVDNGNQSGGSNLDQNKYKTVDNIFFFNESNFYVHIPRK